jgi:3-deoxy-D-manno-octulosonic-acid transferase
MTVSYVAYVMITGVLCVVLFPFLVVYFMVSGRDTAFLQRFGFYSESVASKFTGRPIIWIHAVSVGEVGAALPIIRSFQSMIPNCGIVVSSVTKHGRAYAEKSLDKNIACIYAPADMIFCVRKALSAVRPDILVLLETEIWPVWIHETHRKGIRTAIINGRISSRSVSRYIRIRSLITPVLNLIDAFSMISMTDADRIRLMGAPEHRIFVNGNAKYDRLNQTADASVPLKMAQLYQITDDHIVWVAGSTRSGEEEILLNVYRNIAAVFPNMVLIIAPRHIERSEHIRRIAASQGYACQFRTDLTRESRTAPIVILNTIGELQAAYSIAEIVFCGGSLVPLGGQNILEPAAWGKPVFYGPFMDDFEDAREVLEKTGGGIQVRDENDLTVKMTECLKHPDLRRQIGMRAEKAVREHTGAAEKHAKIIFDLITHSPF